MTNKIKQAKSVFFPATPEYQIAYSVGEKFGTTAHLITSITVSRDMAGNMGWMDAVKVWAGETLLYEAPFSSLEGVSYV